MSIDLSRDGAITSKQHEIASASRSQFASLLALRAVTALVSNNGSLSSLFGADYRDPETVSNNDDAQLQWIKHNTLTHGRRFDEASLPIPIIQHDPTTKHATHHTGSDADHSLPSSATSHQGQLNDENVNSIEKASLDRSNQDDISSSKAFVNTKLATDNSGLMNDIAPPEPVEQAEFNDKTKSRVDSETPKRPARTVHLPPEDVQEQRLSQRLEEVRRPSSSSNADRVHKLHNQAEAASSPSSTVGAYSAATPMPPQDSPDTSPDSETADANIPAEFRPSPIERRAKQEHDRLLEAQKAIAHQAALGDISTPDGQLRWEEREAASREAEEKAATEERKRQQSQQDSLRSIADENEKEDAAKSSLKEETVSAPELDSQEDTIAVKAATKSKTDSARPVSSSSTVSRPVSRSHPADATRRGSEAASAIAVRRRSSLEAVSTVLPRRKLSTPKRPIFDLLQGEELDQHDLHDLDTLKGAAEDPDRDYLEPLFKIQAHDSPNINSSALPDLVRGAYKTISTEDQFTAIHERMEYRILRRIYHLQNANKWSLRQMEKCKEPPQPVSHHDHMMKEMKWMCKDFRAERKQKKSVCAWLAQRCAEWVAADKDERLLLQVRARAREDEEVDDLPELDEDGDSPVNDAAMPGTPPEHDIFISRLVVDPELIDSVRGLQQKGALTRALKQVPVWQPPDVDNIATIPTQSMTRVSKFVGDKVVPHIPHALKKRSRYDYESESDEISDDRPAKRSREERALPPEGPDVAIFHPDNKPIRDRLHAQNAFRPPSEFQMPSVSFYEFRNGSQWIAEDDQKLRKLARDHSFNWSIIADQMQLQSRFKSGQERRTPWECFERWVELEQMPAEMRKTIYFKTWYSRLEQSQQAVERRYQAQMAQHNAQAGGNTPQHTPVRRRTTPIRVEKRKNTRYLWTVDAMRKNAKKRELAAYKQAEATRAAAQRKASQQNDNPQPRRSMPTPQELSQKRYERDLQIAEAHRVHRQKMLEAQRQAQMARAAQQGLTNGTATQRQAGSQNATQQAQSAAAAQQLNNAGSQLTPQQRQALLAAQNGQMNASQANGQSVPQAQMQTTAQNATQQNLQRLTAQLQARNMQLTPQQQQMILQSAGLVGKNWQALSVTQQAALIAAYQQRNANNTAQASSAQASASPSMPPPPAPANASQQLSSGHVPALFAIKNMYRAKHPQLTEDQLNQLATEYLKSQQTNQSRQNAINAAAGINNAQSNGSQSSPNMAMYNQAQFQNNTNGNTGFNADGTQVNGSNGMANDQRNYKMMMHQRQMAQLRLNQGSPQTGHAIPNGSPNMHHASPNMAPVSPNVQFANANLANQRPSSRSSTPQMQRLGSSGSVPGVALSGVQSPGAINVRGSPQNMHANMAR